MPFLTGMRQRRCFFGSMYVHVGGRCGTGTGAGNGASCGGTGDREADADGDGASADGDGGVESMCEGSSAPSSYSGAVYSEGRVVGVVLKFEHHKA